MWLQIAILTVLALLIGGIGLFYYKVHKTFIVPLKEQEKKEQKIEEKKIEQAKIQLQTFTAQESRIKPRIQESEVDDSVDKLRALRRKR